MTPGPAARLWGYLHADHRRLDKRGLAAFVVTGAVLAATAVAAIVWVTGWRAVAHHLIHPNWSWLAVACAGIVVSHAGYLVGYREIARVDGGPDLAPRRLIAVVVTGFGAVIPRGGFAIDNAALCEHGLSPREAGHRVLTLAILEYAVLAPVTFAAALVLWLRHSHAQPGLLPSWLIGVPVGTVVTLLLLAVRHRISGRGAFRRSLGNALDAIRSTLRLFGSGSTGARAAAGMAVYWAADIAALGACLAMFDGHVSIPGLVVGYATGYALTRRSLPLAGAGAVEALLPFALSWVSAPLAGAVLAVFVYRLFNVWLVVAPAAAGLRHLRRSAIAAV